MLKAKAFDGGNLHRQSRWFPKPKKQAVSLFCEAACDLFVILFCVVCVFPVMPNILNIIVVFEHFKHFGHILDVVGISESSVG